jgi:hypothetical protein
MNSVLTEQFSIESSEDIALLLPISTYACSASSHLGIYGKALNPRATLLTGNAAIAE